MAQELKKRSEMDPKYQWRLTDIYADDAAFEADFQAVARMVKDFAAFEGKVQDDPRAAIRAYFAIDRKMDKLYGYASMKHDEDSGNDAYQAAYSRTRSLYVQAMSTAAFMEPELLAMPEESLRALIEDADFADYSVYLSSLLRQKPHCLDAAQEQLLAAAGEVLGGPHDIFNMFDSVDVPFPEVTDEDGHKIRLTHANYGALIRSHNRAVRREAYEAMMGTFGKFAATVGATYAASVKGDLFTARARHYASCRAASLEPVQIPEQVYDSLLAAVENALPILTRVLKLRQKKMGLDTLHMYDLYTPIIEGFDLKMNYEQAFQLVKEALAPLGEDYLALLQRAHDEGWIDVYENKNKRSGAYSSGCYDVHPFVLLNHTDDLNGASTLAHELGHAMHSWHSDRALPYAKAGYSLFVAEVASTCNEVLLLRHLLNKFKDDSKAVAYLCNQFIEEFRTTVFRQTMFAAFEKESHLMAERGEALTHQALTDVYRKLNEKYYGGACEMDDFIGYEWLRIPHFYRAFYVYQYATGFSAAVAIADRILTLGDEAVQDYKKFLSAGGSVPPIEALKYAGVDMNDPATVSGALQVFADTVDRLEKALAEE